jgi:hypothetical protein
VRFLRSGWHCHIAAGIAAAVLLLGSTAASAARGVAHGTARDASLAGYAHAAAHATVGPGPVATQLRIHGYRLELRLMPNRATVAAGATVDLSRHGAPVDGAQVRLTYTMLGMGPAAGIVRVLPRIAPGRYGDPGPTLGMGGRWGLRVDVTPRQAAPLRVDLVDRMRP